MSHAWYGSLLLNLSGTVGNRNRPLGHAIMNARNQANRYTLWLQLIDIRCSVPLKSSLHTPSLNTAAFGLYRCCVLLDRKHLPPPAKLTHPFFGGSLCILRCLLDQRNYYTEDKLSCICHWNVELTIVGWLYISSRDMYYSHWY